MTNTSDVEAESIGERLQAERRGVAIAAAVVIVWACWRTRYGVDLGDGAHAVVMAIRLARGAVPFADEMNAQVTGSFLAVPFTWLWLHLFGLSGIVLASRLFYVALSSAAGYLAYRALRPAFRPWVAFGFPALALVPTSFNLMLVSYTTAPGIATVVAVAAGHAAVTRDSRRWAAVCGSAAALAGLSHPAAVPPSALLIVLCVVLARVPRVRLAVLAGAAAVAFGVLVWVVGVAGVWNVRETLRYTSDYQAVRLSPAVRAKIMMTVYWDGLVSWRYLATWALGLLALAPRIGLRMRAGLLVAAACAAAVPSYFIAGTSEVAPSPFGRYSGLYAAVVVIALWVPAVAVAYRARRRKVLVLLALAVPPALLSLPIIGAVSSANPLWGPAATTVVAAFGAVLVVPATIVPPRSHTVPAVTIGLCLAAVMSVQMLFSFRDVAPWDTDTTIGSGAYAGVRTTRSMATGYLGQTRDAIERWSGPRDSVYVYDNPGAYLFVRGTIDTNIIWVPTHGANNQAALDYFTRRGGFPDVVFMFSAGPQEAALGEKGWRKTDPFVDYVYAHYRRLDTGTSYVVFRRPPRPGRPGSG